MQQHSSHLHGKVPVHHHPCQVGAPRRCPMSRLLAITVGQIGGVIDKQRVTQRRCFPRPTCRSCSGLNGASDHQSLPNVAVCSNSSLKSREANYSYGRNGGF